MCALKLKVAEELKSKKLDIENDSKLLVTTTTPESNKKKKKKRKVTDERYENGHNSLVIFRPTQSVQLHGDASKKIFFLPFFFCIRFRANAVSGDDR